MTDEQLRAEAERRATALSEKYGIALTSTGYRYLVGEFIAFFKNTEPNDSNNNDSNNNDSNISQLIMLIEHYLDDNHIIRHCSAFKQVKKSLKK